MSKVRRFRVETLLNVGVGDALILPPEELRHARVLRLDHDAPIELFDNTGRSASAVLTATAGELAARILSVEESRTSTHRLAIAAAWPKGKRSSVMVEKCSELGLDRLIPIHYTHSVVTKDDEAEGVARLRRIAVEAAKQSGRNEPLQIAAEITFAQALAQEVPSTLALMAEPRAEASLVDILQAERSNIVSRSVLIFIGPEGGYSAEELAQGKAHGLRQVKLARNVLRVETAAIAACSITRAVLD